MYKLKRATTEKKASKQYFHVVPFVLLYEVVLTNK